MQPFGLGDAAALGSSDMHHGSSFLAGPKRTIAYDPLAVTSIHLSLLPSRCLISYNSDLQLTVQIVCMFLIQCSNQFTVLQLQCSQFAPAFLGA
jgi:hypothetical protein